MDNVVFNFELKSWLRSPLFYFLLLGFFLFPLVSMLGTGGYFDDPLITNEQLKFLNSPYEISSISFLMTKMLLIIVGMVAGLSLYRDFNTHFYSILYTYPVSKTYLLRGKLGSVFCVLFLFGMSIFVGIMCGEWLLGEDNPRIAPFNIFGYGIALLVYLLPTILSIAIFVFVGVGYTKNILTGFVVVFCFVLLQLILENIFFNNRDILALLDPFGQNSFFLATQDWDFKKRNTTALPLSNMVFMNRLLWLVLAFILYRYFTIRFEGLLEGKRKILHFNFFKKKDIKDKTMPSSLAWQEVTYDFSFIASIKLVGLLTVHSFLSVLRSWTFLLCMTFGAFVIFFVQLRATNTGSFTILPSTWMFIGAPLSLYSIIMIFSTFLFSGMLMDKAIKHNMNTLIDVTPVRNWQLLTASINAVTLTQLSQLFIFLLVSIGIQWFNGYYQFELDLYLFHLLCLIFPILLVWNLTSHFVYALMPNFFIALFFLAGIWLAGQSLEEIGLSTRLLKYNALPNPGYSDFYGYGPALKGYILVLAYWGVWGMVLWAFSILLWKRGRQSSIMERWVLLKSRLSYTLLFILGSLLLAFGVLFSKILTAEKKLSNFQLDEVEHKEQWKKYAGLTLPQITSVDLQLDLYTKEERFKAKGSYQLINNSDRSIDTILIRKGYDEITQFNWNGKAELIDESNYLKSHVYILVEPLMPGDSIEVGFEIESSPNILFARNSNVLHDGTYLKQDFLPRLGYQFIEHEWPLEDSTVRQLNYYHRDAAYVNLRSIISVDKDQIAIAPGDLVEQKTTANRTTYIYECPKKVKFNFSFQAAAYQMQEETYKGIRLQILFKKGHDQNIETMKKGIKAALDYHANWLGTYPYKNIRIVEYPQSEGSYTATLTANNVPASELLFSINTKALQSGINLPFYVMAHELTHEWFGNQMIPADAEGAKMLTESITEYLSLCIYEEYFGAEMAEKFLDMQLKRYQNGSRRERGNEPPLYKVQSHQEYLSYGKGAIAFKRIEEQLGKEKLKQILKLFFQKNRQLRNNYPTSLDLIKALKRDAKPEEIQWINYWLTEKHPIAK